MGKGFWLVGILIVLILSVGAYFLFFAEKCSETELFNPYAQECVNKNVLCNLNGDCTLLEGQTASFPGEALTFSLISAKESQTGRGEARININGLGEVNLINEDNFEFGAYKILLESTDGDSNKIMGASFEVTKSQ